MDDPILEKRLKNMFESRAGELPDESVRKARIRRNVYEKIEREGNYMKKGFMKKASVFPESLPQRRPFPPGMNSCAGRRRRTWA